MPRVAIVSKPQKPELEGILAELLAWLDAHGYEPILDKTSADYLHQPVYTETARTCPRPIRNW